MQRPRCRPRPDPCAYLGCDPAGTTEYAAAGAHVYAVEPSGRLRRVCRLRAPNRLRIKAAGAPRRTSQRRSPR